jgi:uncharacterized membrane protein YebE (DUF533 family)
MKNVPAPLSCAAAAHPELAYLFFPLIALTLLLFAWPDLADAKRIGGGGSSGSEPSYNSGYNKPTPTAKDSSAMAQQAALNAPSRFGGLGGLLMVDEGNSMERAYLDGLARQLKLDPSFKMERECQANMRKFNVSPAPYKPDLA